MAHGQNRTTIQGMKTWMRARLRSLAVLLLLVLLSVGLALVVYLAGSLSLARPPVRLLSFITSTPQPPSLVTPAARFFQLDPAIIDFLDNRQPRYGIVPLDVADPNLPAIGAFLPRTGNAQFQLAAPTPLPSPLPYPTSPPLPTPTPVIVVVVPATVPLSVLPPPTPLMAAVQGDCAPAGNPVDGLLTQRYTLAHPGIDLALPLGSPVMATHSGKIIFAGWSDIGYGYLIILQSGPFITYYAHNTSFNVEPGDTVGKGSVLAWSGSTGNSSGPHVHYETRINDIPVDPVTFENRGYPTC